MVENGESVGDPFLDGRNVVVPLDADVVDAEGEGATPRTWAYEGGLARGTCYPALVLFPGTLQKILEGRSKFIYFYITAECTKINPFLNIKHMLPKLSCNNLIHRLQIS